jgi:hypothetical protein
MAWADSGNNNNQGGNNNNQGGGTHSAPEIDGTLAVSALAILTGGALLIGDRVRKIRRSREG